MSTQTGTATNETSAHLLQRCPDVWFDDGNCVLQAEDTLFRVYTGVLSKYSSFFKTLFALPQPPNDDSAVLEYEGCPVVSLHDSAADMHNFLKSIFDLQ